MRPTHPDVPDGPSQLTPQNDLLGSKSDSAVFHHDATIQSPRVVPQVFSHYELLESVGEGQFGTVWRAKDQRLGRIVALKLPHLKDFDERRRMQFLREARAVAALNHPRIVQVYGVDEDGDQVGIVSQFIEGKTLSELLEDQRPTIAESARILAIVSDALHHAHVAGVVHRDLKPSNILMDFDGQPYVSDFGLAKWSDGQSLLTNPGLVLGTPAYMSPEQAGGDSHLADRRSDVYSLGVILYELLTGDPPFVGNSTLLLHQIQRQVPRAPRLHDATIPLDLETICLKCLAKSPVDRYSTAKELSDDLQKFLANIPISAQPISFKQRCLRWTRHNPTLASLAAVSILSTITALGLSVSLFGPEAHRAEAGSIPVPSSSINVLLTTEPEGAKVVFYPLNPSTGEPLISRAICPDEKSPVKADLAPGDYLVVTALPDGRFHEVYRHVPRDVHMQQRFYPHGLWEVISPNAISLYSVEIPPLREERGMSHLAEGWKDEAGSTTREIRPFLLDQHEVKIGEVPPKFGHRLPPSLRNRDDLLQSLDLPITGLLLDEAMTFAELSGKRLPTATEYEFAATNGWTTLYPWGNQPPPDGAWQIEAQAKLFDQTMTSPPIYGLFSNVSEFVFSGGKHIEQGDSTRFLIITPEVVGQLVRGGPLSIPDNNNITGLIDQGARFQIGCSRIFRNFQVGFRCAKSKSPRL